MRDQKVAKEAVMLGSIINNKYEIKQLLVESGQYDIYTATEAETGSTVVLKMLREEWSANSERVKLFSDEVKMFSKLTHPFVAQVLDFDQYEGRPYVVTELVEGEDLRSWINRGEGTFEANVLVTKHIGEVLLFAFESGLNYRHVKQSNIMRTKEGRIKILSFSLPRLKLVSSNESDAGSGIQSDLFFLGTTLFEMISGETPIRRRGGINEHWDTRLKQAMRIRYPQLDPELIMKITDIIEKTFTRDLKLRYADHQPFLKELTQVAVQVKKLEPLAPKALRQTPSSASEIVDAIHGRVPSGTVPPEGRQKTSGSPIPAAVGGKGNPQRIAVVASFAGGGSKTGATKAGTAVAVAEAPEENPEEMPQFGRPILHLIKGGKDFAKSAIWRYADEQSWHRNPLIMISSGIFLMLLFILFW